MKMRKIAAMGLSAVMAASMVPALPVMADGYIWKGLLLKLQTRAG